MAKPKSVTTDGDDPLERLNPNNLDVEEWLKLVKNHPKPNEKTENVSNFREIVALNSQEGEGLDRPSLPHELEPNNRNTDLSPEDETYQSALRAVWHAIEALPECNHKGALVSFLAAAENLPAGEVYRLAQTAENKTNKWAGIPKVAPVLYQNRVASQALPDFLIAHYGELVQGEMDTSHFEVIDPACSAAIRRWLKGNKPFPHSIVMSASHTRPSRKRTPNNS